MVSQEQVVTQDTVYALSAAPDASFWLAARQSGLQRSDDEGQSWQPVMMFPDQEVQPLVTALAVARLTDGEIHLLAGIPGGVLISRDAGKTWTSIMLATPAPFVTVLAVSPDYRNDGIAFAATIEDGVFRTTDYGETWRAWHFGLFDLHVLGLAVSPDFAHDTTVYASTESGVYRSQNAGRSWQMTGFSMDAAPVLCVAISSDSAQNGRLYAGTEAAGLYTSADRGLSWQRIGPSDIGESVNAILPGEQDMLIVTSEHCWLSSDMGATWTPYLDDLDFGGGLTTVHAPQGFATGNPLLLGLVDGRILTTT